MSRVLHQIDLWLANSKFVN